MRPLRSLVAAPVLVLGLAGSAVLAPATPVVPAPAAQAAVVSCHTYTGITRLIYNVRVDTHEAIGFLHYTGRVCGLTPGGVYVGAPTYQVWSAGVTNIGNLHRWTISIRSDVELGLFSDGAGGSYEVRRVYLSARGCAPLYCTSTAYFHVSYRLVKPKWLAPYFIWTTGLVGENTAGVCYRFYLNLTGSC